MILQSLIQKSSVLEHCLEWSTVWSATGPNKMIVLETVRTKIFIAATLGTKSKIKIYNQE